MSETTDTPARSAAAEADEIARETRRLRASSLTPAMHLQNVVAMRDALRAARRAYHDAITDAAAVGQSDRVIAFALNTQPLYIANTLRLHREGTCGCAPDSPQG